MIRRLVAGLSAVVMLLSVSSAVSQEDTVLLYKGMQSLKAMSSYIKQELDRLERSPEGVSQENLKLIRDDLTDTLNKITAQLTGLEQRYIKSLRAQQAVTTAPAAKD